MLKSLLKNKEFSKIIKEFLKKLEILDIILFGSAVREKDEPQDLDILVLYSNQDSKNTETSYELRKRLEKLFKNIQVISKTYAQLFKPEFQARISLLSEGYSLRNGNFISRGLGYKNIILFKYSLGDLSKSKRMIFYYTLYGRNKEKGLLEKNNAVKFSDSIILAQTENSETIKEFFEKSKIEYRQTPILIPENFKLEK